MRAIGYVRVSTEEQARDGVSLDAQSAKVRGFCTLHGIELVDLVTDAGVSAKSLARPGLESALGRLDRGEADGLVVAKLDRLSRSVRDWAALIEGYFGPDPREGAGKQLWSVGDSIDTTTAAGRMVLNILMTIAQWEREAIAERTRDALNHKRSRGECVGTVPRGYRREGSGLTPHDEERVDMAVIRILAAAGRSPRAISAEMRGRSPDRAWSASTIRRILARDEP